ncbi:MAG: radical SAM protein [bacterium]
MGIVKKLDILCEGANNDLCMPSHKGFTKWIYPASLPQGGIAPILKLLMENACIGNCAYCANRQGRNYETTSISPDELSSIFMQMFQKKLVCGLFLSSTVPSSPDKTMEKMIKTAEILRNKHKFSGYIHLKIMPKAGDSYIEKAVELADRVSLNLEAPNPERLLKIASQKDFIKDLIKPMEVARDLILKKKGRVKTQTTQFVVGASDENDYEILKTTDWLYKKLNLHRAYFSAFRPIKGTPLENHPPTLPIREHRLYQADFLLKRYRFSFSDIPFDKDGNLSLQYDPKMVWAMSHPERFPLDVNKAEYHELLRVPGIGPISARRIVTVRAKSRFNTQEELKAAGIVLKRALPFLLLYS